jgi:DNA-binding response OmpR family regulator
VIEDHPELRGYLMQLLSRQFRTLGAGDGAQALALVPVELPDVIISDWMMPGIDGIALLAELRSDPRTSCIPVIMLSAKMQSADVIQGLEQGADDYLIKPFDAAELLARVGAQLARQQRLRRQLARDDKAPAAPDASSIASADPDVTALRNHTQNDKHEHDSAIQTTLGPGLAQLLALTDAHLSDPNFDVTAWAKYFSIDRRTLHRQISNALGTSPVELLRKRRLERACELMRAGETNVAQIAYACGFESLSYFSRCFKADLGETPSAWIKHRYSLKRNLASNYSG